jgi:xylulokinase
MGHFTLVYDLGTTACKSVLFDFEGRLIRSIDIEYPTNYARPGWAEQNPDDWWKAVVLSTREILATQGIIPSDIAGISFSGQMEGCILLDSKGQTVRPAIIHLDSRARKEAEWLKQVIGVDKIIEITGNLVDAECTLSKILWVKNNEPGSFQKAKIFLSGAKDYIAHRFSGGRAFTDYVDASISFLFDIRKYEWSDPLLRDIGITKDNLAEPVPSSTIIGEVSSQASFETGVKVGTPLIMGGGDAGCAAVGAGCVLKGDTCANIGSTAWIATVSDSPLAGKPQGLYNLRHPDPKLFMPIGAVLSAGHSYRWLREQFGAMEASMAKVLGMTAYNLMDEEAEVAEPGSDGLIFLPYLMGERTPYRDHNARGVFFGLSLSHKRQHVIRAVLEGVAYGLRNVIDTFEQLGLSISDVRLFGGGTKGLIWQEIMSNIFERKILVPQIVEVTSFGAAITCGVGLGIYKDYTTAKKLIRIDRTVVPDTSISKLYAEYYRIYISLYPILKEKFAQLAKAREAAERHGSEIDESQSD